MLATSWKTHAKPRSRKDNSLLVLCDFAKGMGRPLREDLTNAKEVAQRDFFGVGLLATANARVVGFLCDFAALREIFLRNRLRFTNPVSHPQSRNRSPVEDWAEVLRDPDALLFISWN